jgi:hypothetical protein
MMQHKEQIRKKRALQMIEDGSESNEFGVKDAPSNRSQSVGYKSRFYTEIVEQESKQKELQELEK